jgi:hypothetical protein
MCVGASVYYILYILYIENICVLCIKHIIMCVSLKIVFQEGGDDKIQENALTDKFIPESYLYANTYVALSVLGSCVRACLHSIARLSLLKNKIQFN